MSQQNNQTFNLIKELGLKQLSEKEQKELLEKMGKVVYERILIKVIKKLTDEEASKLTELLKEKKIEEFGKYLDEKVPNSASIMKEEVEKYRKEIIEAIKE
jgi:hypothetical protein